MGELDKIIKESSYWRFDECKDDFVQFSGVKADLFDITKIKKYFATYGPEQTWSKSTRSEFFNIIRVIAHEFDHLSSEEKNASAFAHKHSLNPGLLYIFPPTSLSSERISIEVDSQLDVNIILRLSRSAIEDDIRAALPKSIYWNHVLNKEIPPRATEYDLILACMFLNKKCRIQYKVLAEFFNCAIREGLTSNDFFSKDIGQYYLNGFHITDEITLNEILKSPNEEIKSNWPVDGDYLSRKAIYQRKIRQRLDVFIPRQGWLSDEIEITKKEIISKYGNLHAKENQLKFLVMLFSFSRHIDRKLSDIWLSGYKQPEERYWIEDMVRAGRALRIKDREKDKKK
jgi:hypothetical protein